MTVGLQAAFSTAAAGTVIQLTPGIYSTTAVVENVHGDVDAPVVIRGMGAETIFVGTRYSPSGSSLPPYVPLPTWNDEACIKVRHSSWLLFENLEAANCWPTFLFIVDSQYLTLRGSNIAGSTHAVFARDEQAHHILLENNHWNQDPTGELWRTIFWEEAHHGAYAFFNGGLFRSSDIPGDVIVRGNRVDNAYNAVRMKIRDQAGLPPGQRNRNVEIYDNEFHNIRDNVIEPEREATNWWFHHNLIHNSHATFSFDGVEGGYFYLFGNVGTFSERPGVAEDENRGGKLFKFSKKGPFPEHPLYFFNNTFYVRFFITKKGSTRNLHHLNNVYKFCEPTDFAFHGDEICNNGRYAFLSEFGDVDESGGGYVWNSSNRFDYDLVNSAFPALLTDAGQEQHGIAVDSIGLSGMSSASGGRVVEADGSHRLTTREAFALDRTSAAIDAGSVIDIDDGLVSWHGSEHEGARPDIGAYEGSRPMTGPAFVHMGIERPRIVRATWNSADGTVLFVFSRPIGLVDDNAAAELSFGGQRRSVACSARGSTLSCSIGRQGGGCELPDSVSLPSTQAAAADGELATAWGAPRLRCSNR